MAYPLSIVAIPTHAVWPYMQQWNLSVEREVLKNTVLQVGYVGSKGTHLALNVDAEPVIPDTPWRKSLQPWGAHRGTGPSQSC